MTETNIQKTREQMIDAGIAAFNNMGGLLDRYYTDTRSTTIGKRRSYKIDTLRRSGDGYVGEGLELDVHEDGDTLMYAVKEHGTVWNTDRLAEIGEKDFDEEYRLIAGKFTETFNMISQRSFLFKFEDGESRTYEQVAPIINGAKRGNFMIYFYYAPTKDCFRIVSIHPDNIETEVIEDGTRLKSFKYTEHQITIAGSTFSSSDRSLMLYKFKSDKLIQSGPDVGFKNDSIYLLSEWHYNAILEIIKS